MGSGTRAPDLAGDAPVASSRGSAMITFAVIYLGPEEVSPSLIERLRSIYADRVFKQGFFLKLPVDDPRTREAIKLLDGSGLRPWRSETGPPVKGVEYTFRMDRQYEPSDLAQCSLLELSPPDEAHNAEAIFRAHDGEMIVPQGSTPDGFGIMSSLPYWYFVPERVKGRQRGHSDSTPADRELGESGKSQPWGSQPWGSDLVFGFHGAPHLAGIFD